MAFERVAEHGLSGDAFSLRVKGRRQLLQRLFTTARV